MIMRYDLKHTPYRGNMMESSPDGEYIRVSDLLESLNMLLNPKHTITGYGDIERLEQRVGQLIAENQQLRKQLEQVETPKYKFVGSTMRRPLIIEDCDYDTSIIGFESFQMTEKDLYDISNWPEWLKEAWHRPKRTLGALWVELVDDRDGIDTVTRKVVYLQTADALCVINYGDRIVKHADGSLSASYKVHRC
jgi:hypothetical protein